MRNVDYDSIINSMNVDDLIKIPSPDYIGYIWRDKDGNETQDKKKLVNKEEVKFPQTRYAETSEDYEFILMREAEKKNQTIEDYVEILLEDIKVMLEQNVNEYRALNIDLTDKRVRVKKFIKYLENRKIETETKIESLAEIITHENNIGIVDAIKVQYKNIAGKNLKLLFLTMQELSLIPNNLRKFYKCCEREFEWNIGSYESLRKVEYNGYTDTEVSEQMQIFFEKLINT